MVLGATLIGVELHHQRRTHQLRPLARKAVIPALENILALNGAALTLDVRYLQGGHLASASRQLA